MKGYNLFRGLMKASAFASIMFVMQACYGAPQEPYWVEEEENETSLVTDTIQETIEENVTLENE